MAVTRKELRTSGRLEIRDTSEVRYREFHFFSDNSVSDGMATEQDLARSLRTAQFAAGDNWPLWVGSDWDALNTGTAAFAQDNYHHASPQGGSWETSQTPMTCRDVNIVKAGASPVSSQQGPISDNRITSFIVTFMFSNDPSAWQVRRQMMTTENTVPLVVDLDKCASTDPTSKCLTDQFQPTSILDQAGRQVITLKGSEVPFASAHVAQNYELIDCGSGIQKPYSQFVLEMEKVNVIRTLAPFFNLRNFMKTVNRETITIQPPASLDDEPFFLEAGKWLLDEAELELIGDGIYTVRARFVYDDYYHRYITVKKDCSTASPQTIQNQEYIPPDDPTDGGGGAPAPIIGTGEGGGGEEFVPEKWALVSHRVYPVSDWTWLINDWLS